MIEAVFHGVILAIGLILPLRRSKCICVQPRSFAAEIGEGPSRRCHCGDLRYDFDRGGCIGGFTAHLDIHLVGNNHVCRRNSVFAVHRNITLAERPFVNGGGSGTVFSEKTNLVCRVGFFIKPPCDHRYDRCHRVECLELFGRSPFRVHVDDNHYFMVLVFRTRCCRKGAWQVGHEREIHWHVE